MADVSSNYRYAVRRRDDEGGRGCFSQSYGAVGNDGHRRRARQAHKDASSTYVIPEVGVRKVGVICSLASWNQPDLWARSKIGVNNTALSKHWHGWVLLQSECSIACSRGRG